MIRFCVDGVLSYVPIWSRGVRPSVTGGQILGDGGQTPDDRLSRFWLVGGQFLPM